MKGDFAVMRVPFVPTVIFSSVLVLSLLLFPLSVAEKESPTFLASLSPLAEVAEDVSCAVSEEAALPVLARAVENAVGDRPFAVRVAFAAVILNRVSSGGFGNGVSAVLSSSGLYPTEETVPSERSKRAAREALAGADPTLEAIYIVHEDDPELSRFGDRITVRIADLVFVK